MTAPIRRRPRYTRAALQDRIDELEAEAVARVRNISPELPAVAPGGDAFRELPAGAARTMLWRIRGDGRPEYVETYSAGEFTLDAVRDAWGAGKYLVRSFDSDDQETGVREFYIGERIKTADQLAIDLAALHQAQHPPNGYNGNGNGRAAPGPDPFDIAAKFAAASAAQIQGMMQLITPLLAPRGDDATTRLVLVELLKQKAPDPLDQLTKFRELLGDGQSSGDYSDVLREVGKPLVQMLARSAPEMNGGGPGPPRQLPPAPVVAAPEVRIASRTPFVILAPHIGTIIDLAAAGEDPQLWAAAIELEAPEAVELLAGVVARVGEVGAVSAIIRTFPDLEPFGAWLAALVSSLLAGSDDAEPEAPAE